MRVLAFGNPCDNVTQEARAASVRALTDGVLLALHRDDFNKLLGSLSHIRHMWRFEALRKARLMLQAWRFEALRKARLMMQLKHQRGADTRSWK